MHLRKARGSRSSAILRRRHRRILLIDGRDDRNKRLEAGDGDLGCVRHLSELAIDAVERSRRARRVHATIKGGADRTDGGLEFGGLAVAIDVLARKAADARHCLCSGRVLSGKRLANLLARGDHPLIRSLLVSSGTDVLRHVHFGRNAEGG